MKRSGVIREEVVTVDNESRFDPGVDQVVTVDSQSNFDPGVEQAITVESQPKILNDDTDQEKIAVVDRYPQRFLNFPQQILRKITREIDPQAKGESNQKVYEREKIRSRGNQFIWYFLIVIEVLLGLRFILKVASTDPSFGFARIIYPITDIFVFPFNGIASGSIANDEWSTIFAGIVYLCIAWAIIYLLHLVNPITPRNLETR